MDYHMEPHHHHTTFHSPISPNKLINLPDAMHFPDFELKLPTDQSKICIDGDNCSWSVVGTHRLDEEQREDPCEEEEETRFLHNIPLPFLSGVQNKKKRPRSTKTSKEAESQRMAHIAVERNRRRQMNEHLRVLRSLMPGSYVQRGDQASIVGGAIEFVRELEQLLQCLESQKRRRLMGSGDALGLRSINEDASPLPSDPCGFTEEVAESKTSLGDIEIRLLGFEATIKILTQRRPSQLIKLISAFQDLGFDILHSNITTVEQTVLYSFNAKISGEARWSAEDMATSIQEILSFIDACTLISS